MRVEDDRTIDIQQASGILRAGGANDWRSIHVAFWRFKLPVFAASGKFRYLMMNMPEGGEM
jgi:hypothetical protein